MARLEGKVALITGGASGMGAAHVRVFLDEGAKVIITDINEELGSSLAKELGANALFLSHDVSEPESWAAVVKAGEAAFGPITVLVNNAGIPGPVVETLELRDSDYLRIIDIDQNGVFYGMRAVLPAMIAAGGGSIVNISSLAGMAHKPGSPNIGYTGAKFAVRGMTKATAVEYAKHGVRVNSVHPGAILTPLNRTWGEDALAGVAASIPIGRFAEPEEVSFAVLFLASDEARYITGVELIVDGGILAA
ncbi:glucose 1-dehydrogenase [Microbacterium sp. cx-55]|uniref:SDR family NAD(P)-dependent oxidoreductase n=1 Tax=Microbacterium sp. cx-55 TaxID=2875948 RepID=UPI001CBE2943|nr:glucose 1-dehydrogenase [Microbacterium sp. cx-55]MBZ4486764.1 glucose 1-dehydrogenase [Microbacterium sp. cx-55]UGB36280.1 glucose 1-dehydrogenase [Microbacterium sp. cx-55]